jgi:hypothetical protein
MPYYSTPQGQGFYNPNPYRDDFTGNNVSGGSMAGFGVNSRGRPADGLFGMFGGTLAPESGDYTQAATQQARMGADAINQQTQQNRPDQFNAFGSGVTWSMGPDGQPVQRQSFGGGGLGQGATGLQQQFGQTYSQGFNYSPDQARNQAIDSAYGQATSRLDPQFNQRQEQLQTQLMNQGLDPQSEAYKNAMGDFSRERNDAYNGALSSAIGQGTQAGNTLFQQALQQRALPMQELAGLNQFTGQQGFNSAGVAAPPQLLQAGSLQDASNYRNWQANNQAQGDFTGALGNFGTGVVSAAGKLFGF